MLYLSLRTMFRYSMSIFWVVFYFENILRYLYIYVNIETVIIELDIKNENWMCNEGRLLKLRRFMCFRLQYVNHYLLHNHQLRRRNCAGTSLSTSAILRLHLSLSKPYFSSCLHINAIDGRVWDRQITSKLSHVDAQFERILAA